MPLPQVDTKPTLVDGTESNPLLSMDSVRCKTRLTTNTRALALSDGSPDVKLIQLPLTLRTCS